jgi:hypothetical protein
VQLEHQPSQLVYGADPFLLVEAGVCSPSPDTRPPTGSLLYAKS